MSPRGPILLTARREIRERVRSRAFRASTVVQVLLVVGVVAVAALTGGSGPDRATLATAGAQARATAAAARAREGAYDLRVTVRPKPTPAAARATVEAKDADAALVPRGLVVRSGTSDRLVGLVQDASARVRAVEVLRRSGLPAREIRRAVAPTPLAVTDVGDDADGGGAGLAFIGALLLYVAILTYGYVVAGGVVEEKSSRVVELLLATIRPAQLLAGKVLGIGAVGLIQLVAIGGVGVAAALITGQVDLPSGTAASVVLVVVYFVLGYVLYACAFAAAGAIVSRQEDLQSTTSPLLLVLIAGYLVGLSTIDKPSSTLAEVCTFLPPVAPLVVPGRAAQDALPLWQLAVSLALMLAAILLLVRVTGRIYERAILRVGAPLKLTQALRLARSGGPR